MVTDTIVPPWECQVCGQLNAGWAKVCGRCAKPRGTPVTVEELRLAAPRSGDAYSELLLRWAADEIDALAERLAEAERAILDLWRGQIRCGYSCNRSDNAAHVNGKVWGDVACRFQHIINPERAADRAKETP